MSRTGKKPIPIPQEVSVSVAGSEVIVKGPKGTLSRRIHPDIGIEVAGDEIRLTRPGDGKRHRALHGLMRSLVANMVEGVTQGFARRLEIQGVGYRAEPRPEGVRLIVGYSHPVEYDAPAGVSIVVEQNTIVTVQGIDKEAVGQAAADIRAVRPPEPYKGKGIRYFGERVRRKAGKTGAKA
ncbi:MAG: 50S ribosomal protein L6 [Gemmatimonadales bacterium]